MKTLTQLEQLAKERIENNNFLCSEVDFNYSYGTFSGYLQITSDVFIDFIDSRYCFSIDGEKIGNVSKELDRALDSYLNENYKIEDSAEEKYERADYLRKSLREDKIFSL